MARIYLAGREDCSRVKAEAEGISESSEEEGKRDEAPFFGGGPIFRGDSSPRLLFSMLDCRGG